MVLGLGRYFTQSFAGRLCRSCFRFFPYLPRWRLELQCRLCRSCKADRTWPSHWKRKARLACGLSPVKLACPECINWTALKPEETSALRRFFYKYSYKIAETVESLCAIMITVLFFKSSCKAVWISCSFSASTFAVTSSKKIVGAFLICNIDSSHIAATEVMIGRFF